MSCAGIKLNFPHIVGLFRCLGSFRPLTEQQLYLSEQKKWQKMNKKWQTFNLMEERVLSVCVEASGKLWSSRQQVCASISLFRASALS